MKIRPTKFRACPEVINAMAASMLILLALGSGAARTEYFVIQDANTELQADLKQLDSFRQSRNLAALESAVESDAIKWQARNRDLFVRYMEHACGALSSYDLGNQPLQASLLNKYAISVLTSGDLTLRDRVQFVEFLAQDPPITDEAGWRQLREDKARLWLETWKRIAESINAKFDFNDRPLLNVAPPPETGLPAGVSPEAVHDPKLRAEYERAIVANAAKSRDYNDQSWLRRNAPSFYREAKNYVVNAYKKAPSDLPQLERLLSAYIGEKQTRDQIIQLVKKTQ